MEEQNQQLNLQQNQPSNNENVNVAGTITSEKVPPIRKNRSIIKNSLITVVTLTSLFLVTFLPIYYLSMPENIDGDKKKMEETTSYDSLFASCNIRYCEMKPESEQVVVEKLTPNTQYIAYIGDIESSDNADLKNLITTILFYNTRNYVLGINDMFNDDAQKDNALSNIELYFESSFWLININYFVDENIPNIEGSVIKINSLDKQWTSEYLLSFDQYFIDSINHLYLDKVNEVEIKFIDQTELAGYKERMSELIISNLIER